MRNEIRFIHVEVYRDFCEAGSSVIIFHMSLGHVLLQVYEAISKGITAFDSSGFYIIRKMQRYVETATEG